MSHAALPWRESYSCRVTRNINRARISRTETTTDIIFDGQGGRERREHMLAARVDEYHLEKYRRVVYFKR